MPIKVTCQNPGLEYDENMVCEDFLNMGMLPLEFPSKHPSSIINIASLKLSGESVRGLSVFKLYINTNINIIYIYVCVYIYICVCM